MYTPPEERIRASSGRPQGRPLTEEQRAARILVKEWTGHPATDYLIEKACEAPKGERLKRAFDAVASLAEIAARDEEQHAVAKLVIKSIRERAGWSKRAAEDKVAKERIWDRFNREYAKHKAPMSEGRIEACLELVRRAIELDKAVGRHDYSKALEVWKEALTSAGDNLDPFLPVAPIAEKFYAILPADVPWKPREQLRRKAENTLSAAFGYFKRLTRDRFIGLRSQFPHRRLYAVDPPPIKPRDRFQLTFLDDIEEKPTKEWLIDDFLGQGEFTCFWGMPGSGKSVIVSDAAFHVAAGCKWFGKDVNKGLVVFIAAERAELTRRRFAALRKKSGVERIPLALVEGRLDLTNGTEDAKAIVDLVRGAEKTTGQPCVWLIIDTVARTFGVGDENAAKDMGAYVQACDLIRQEIGNTHLSLVHHCSRQGEKPRGSIALDGAVDATFKVAKNGQLHSVAIDKENDTPDAGVLRFKLASIELGHDRKGKPTTAPVVVRDETTVAAFETADGVKVSISRDKRRKATIVFEQALEEAGEVKPGTDRKAVFEGKLRKRLREAFTGPNVKESSLDTIVRRELKGLTDKGDAVREGEWFFPTQADRCSGMT